MQRRCYCSLTSSNGSKYPRVIDEIAGDKRCCREIGDLVSVYTYETRNGVEGVDDDGNSGPEYTGPNENGLPATIDGEEIGWRTSKVMRMYQM